MSQSSLNKFFRHRVRHRIIEGVERVLSKHNNDCGDRQTTPSNVSRVDTVLDLLRLIIRSQACVKAYTKSLCLTDRGLTEHVLEIIPGKGYLTIVTFSPGMMRYGNHTDLCETPEIRSTQVG